MKKCLVKIFCIIWALIAVGTPITIFVMWGRSINWIEFWASYTGAILGSTASLIAFYATSKQNGEFHKDSIKQNHRENNNTRKEAREQNRLQILPYISVQYKNVDFNENIGGGRVLNLNELDSGLIIVENIIKKYSGYINGKEFAQSNLLKLEFKNIGNGSAVQCGVIRDKSNIICPLQSIEKSDFVTIYALFPIEGGKYKFFIQFDDIQGRRYNQNFTLKYGYRDLKRRKDSTFVEFEATEKPTLIS